MVARDFKNTSFNRVSNNKQTFHNIMTSLLADHTEWTVSISNPPRGEAYDYSVYTVGPILI